MICQNCGCSLQENFCPNCGEKRFDSHSLTIKHYLEETFEGLAHFDNKFFRTIKTLVARPGKLSREYVEGRRVRYMKPVQFFLVVNVLFFVLTLPNRFRSNPFSQPLQSYMQFSSYTKFHTKEAVEAKLKKLSIPFNEYELLFDEKMSSNSKEFIFLLIPFYGMLFFLAFIFKKIPFVGHLVFATHFIAFIILWFLVSNYVLGLPYYLIAKVNYSASFDIFISFLGIAVIFSYLFLAVRRFYKAHWAYTLLICIVLGWFFWGIVQYYRMFLFYKVIYLN